MSLSPFARRAPTSARGWAHVYLRQGRCPIPVLSKSKVPGIDGNLMLASTHITYGSGAANLAAATAGSNPLTDDDIAAVKLALSTRSIPTFSDGFYCMVLSPQHQADLRKDDQYREVVRYVGAQGPL